VCVCVYIYVCASVLPCEFVRERARARERQHKGKTAAHHKDNFLAHITRRNTQFAHTSLPRFPPFSTHNFPRAHNAAPHKISHGESSMLHRIVWQENPAQQTHNTHTAVPHTIFQHTMLRHIKIFRECTIHTICTQFAYNFVFAHLRIIRLQHTMPRHDISKLLKRPLYLRKRALYFRKRAHKNCLDRNYVCVVLLSSPTQWATTHTFPRAPIIATESERARKIFLEHIMRHNTQLFHIFLHTFFSFFHTQLSSSTQCGD